MVGERFTLNAMTLTLTLSHRERELEDNFKETKPLTIFTLALLGRGKG
jgi:hypothetical protein